MNYKKFGIVIVIELLILLVMSPIISNYFIFSTRMEAGSWGIFAPFLAYEKVYSNSQFLSEGFNYINLIIDVLIVLVIALIFSWRKYGK